MGWWLVWGGGVLGWDSSVARREETTFCTPPPTPSWAYYEGTETKACWQERKDLPVAAVEEGDDGCVAVEAVPAPQVDLLIPTLPIGNVETAAHLPQVELGAGLHHLHVVDHHLRAEQTYTQETRQAKYWSCCGERFQLGVQ